MCVAFMPMHPVFVSAKGFKMYLGAVQILTRIFWIFVEFILFSLELNLFLRRLYNLSLKLQIFYLDSSSCLKLSMNRDILLVPSEPSELLQFGHHQIFLQIRLTLCSIYLLTLPTQ
jgi:hypothetical protein